MASEFPGRPKLLKGAIVAFSSQVIAGIPRVVIFQYNPDTLTRTLRPATASGAAADGKSTADARETPPGSRASDGINQHEGHARRSRPARVPAAEP